MKRKKIQRAIVLALIVLVLPFIAYFSFLLVIHDFNPHFLSIDSCLDGGGSWNYENNVCEY